MTQDELSKLMDEQERKIRQQRERIELLNSAIDEFQKQCNKAIALIRESKREQNDFNHSVPDNDDL